MEPRIDYENGHCRAVVVLGTGIPAWLGPWRNSNAAAWRDARELERRLANATVGGVRGLADEEARVAFDFLPDQEGRARHLHNAHALNSLARVRRRLATPVIPASGNVVAFPGAKA